MNAAAPASPTFSSNAYTQAERSIRHTLDAAQRGDTTAMLALIEAHAASALRVSLARIASAANRCAPTLDALRIDAGLYSMDQREMRFAIDGAVNALSQAAGRTVDLEECVVAAIQLPPGWNAADLETFRAEFAARVNARVATPGPPLRAVDEAHLNSDSGELPMPLASFPDG